MSLNIFIEGVRHSPDVDPTLFRNQVKEVSKTSPIQPVDSEPNVTPVQGRKPPIAQYQQEQERRKLLAKHIMSTNIYCLNSDTLMRYAWDIFQNHKFRHIPIISANKKIYGIISDRDMLQLLNQYSQNTSDIFSRSISEFCHKNVLAGSPETPVIEIAKFLLEAKLGSLPIVDQDNRVVGIITRSDILRVVVNHPNFTSWV